MFRVAGSGGQLGDIKFLPFSMLAALFSLALSYQIQKTHNFRIAFLVKLLIE